MEKEPIQRPAIMGTGIMGSALAADLASHGFQVMLHGRSQESLDKGMTAAAGTLERLQMVGLLTSEQAEGAIELIQPEKDFGTAVGQADIVIEAISEDFDAKREIFFRLAETCSKSTILASTTTTLNVGHFAEGMPTPERALLTHYFFPPGMVQAVEVAPTEHTSQETLKTVQEFLGRSGKKAVMMTREVPGLIAGRLSGALLREAGSMVDQGISTPEDIDFLLKSVVGVRYGLAGIFELGDIPGWELLVENLPSLFESLESSKSVPKIFQEKKDSGNFGIKSGRGFYEWSPGSISALQRRMALGLIQTRKLHEEG